MADQPPRPPIWLVKAFMALHIWLYRISGGAIGGRFGRGPVGLLTVAGRKSGKPITSPLIYVPTDRGYAVIASFGGAPKHPSWYLNLTAAGRAVLEVGRQSIAVRAEEAPLDGERYAQIWRDAAALYPDYDVYKTRTSRRIPVVELVAA